MIRIFKRLLRYASVLSSIIVVASCSDASTEQADIAQDSSTIINEDSYSNGSYCGTVYYYNPNTGTRSTYTLTVEVEDGLLSRIHWSNGGWLDDSHFDSPEIDENGYCEFTTFEGLEYEIQIDSEGGCSSTFGSQEEEVDEYLNEDQEAGHEEDSESTEENEEEEVAQDSDI